MEWIEKNPYRVLGVFSNASLKEITANKTKLARYASVGKSVSFEADMDGVLPAVLRTEELVGKAFDDLSLPLDKLKHAFFWFAKGDSIDEIALGHINEGNIEKAVELFDKKETWSSLLNRGVLAFIQEEESLAIQKMVKVVHNIGGDYRCGFVASICGDTFQISEMALAHAFMDALIEREEPAKIYRLVKANDPVAEDVAYLRKQIMEAPISRIKAEIAKAKKTCADNGEVAYAAGKELMEDTKVDLELLKALREDSDPTYPMVADSLADQILQCGIDYANFYNSHGYYKNNVEPNDVWDRNLELCNYALGIAEGMRERERCQRNVNQSLKNQSELAPKEVSPYYKNIKKLWDEYGEKPNTIEGAIQLIKDCTPILAAVKELDEFRYRNWSSGVAMKTINTLLAVLNVACDVDASGKRDIQRMKETIKEGWHLLQHLEQLDVDEKGTENRENIKEILQKWIGYIDHFDPNYSKSLYADTQQDKMELKTVEVKNEEMEIENRKHGKKSVFFILAFVVLFGLAILITLL